MDDDKSRGLYGKYDVTRRHDPEGKHLACWYFVLDPQHDPLARKALMEYAYQARLAGYDQLADDIQARLAVTP